MRGNVEERLFLLHAEMCQVFSHPKRLELISVLGEGEMSAGELARRLKLSPANLSQHLSMMKERRLLVSRKEGNVVYNRIANPKLLQAFSILQEILIDQLREDAALVKESGG